MAREHSWLVAPDKIFVDEGVYFVAVWTDVANAAPKGSDSSEDTTINKANGKPRIWQVLRISRIEKAELVEPVERSTFRRAGVRVAQVEL